MMPNKQNKPSAKILPGAVISGCAILSPDGLTVSIIGINGVPGTPLLARLGKERMYLPSATIANVPHFAKYVAWDGDAYSFHASKQEIIRAESLMLIGRIQRQTAKVRPLANPPHDELRENNPRETTSKLHARFPSSIHTPSAAQKMETYMKSKGMNQTEFAIHAGTTDKTIRKFRQTGRIKRSILADIAKAMGTTKEELLK